jgi:hypothetical protein
MLTLLDHGHDGRVRAALECLQRLLGDEPPQRRAVLDARLRRPEDAADVRLLAGSLRKEIAGRR